MQVDTALNAAENRAASGGKPQPEPIRCDCGLFRVWRIWPNTASKHHGKHAPRWTQPKVNPCKDCDGTRIDPLDSIRFESRQKRAGIDLKDREWRWANTTVQKPGETPDQFAKRVKGTGAIGVLRRNVEAAQQIAKWNPGEGHSIYVYGKTGSGKTVYASATASRLLTLERRGQIERSLLELTAPLGAPVTVETPEGTRYTEGLGYPEAQALKMIEMGRHKVITGNGKAFSVMCCPETELYERVKLGWSKDRAPLAKITSVDGLILDDLGENGTKAPGAVEAIQRLIRARYASGKPMIITSNIPFHAAKRGADTVLDGISDWYGDRVASRLAEMCGPHIYSLGSTDWRNYEAI